VRRLGLTGRQFADAGLVVAVIVFFLVTYALSRERIFLAAAFIGIAALVAVVWLIQDTNRMRREIKRRQG
jgi:uncharacterized membrane protein